MKNINIAVVDSGIDTSDPEIQGKFVYDKDIQIKEIDNIEDMLGHGTLCAKTILERCPDATIYPVKIFSDEGSIGVSNLINGLEILKGKDIDIVNISAAMISENRLSDLKKVCEDLKKEGKILIASKYRKSGSMKSYPASFDSVIGVKGYKRICSDNDYTYDFTRENQMYANGRDRLYMFKGNVTAFGKHSRATALASGIIADLMCRMNISKQSEIEKMLRENSNIGTTYKEKRYMYKKEYIYDYVTAKIIDILNTNFANGKVSMSFIEKNSLINNITGLYGDNVYDFIQMINDEFCIDIDWKSIYMYEVENIYILSHIIHKKIKL